jgi:long-subunit acyl-CoA synthetase (AMP-forming)
MIEFRNKPIHSSVAGELEHCLLISRPRIVVASALVADRVVPVVKQLATSGKLPHDTTTLLLGPGPAPSLLQLASKVKNTQGLPVFVDNAASKISFIMCSSGTTGLPKGVELSNKNALAYHSIFRYFYCKSFHNFHTVPFRLEICCIFIYFF